MVPRPGSARRGDRFPWAGHVFHVHFFTERRTRHLKPFPVSRAVIRAMRLADIEGLTRTLAYTVLPDQVHWLYVLGDFTHRALPVKRVKAWSAAEIVPRVMLPGPLWQPAFGEERIEDPCRVEATAATLLQAPVRAGHAERLTDWPHWDTCFETLLNASARADGLLE